MSASKILKEIKEKDVQYVDVRFTDTRGRLQHVTFDVDLVDEDFLTEGTMFDGSSIAGWKAINESDMLLKPDLTTAYIDPFYQQTTMFLFCDVLNPDTGEPYNRDSRSMAKKALSYVQSSGVGDQVFFGPEAEFFIFDNIRFDQTANHGFYYIDAEEGRWNSGRKRDNLGYRPRFKEGYFPVPPTDHYQDLRAEMPEPEGMLTCLEMLRTGDGGYANQPDMPVGLTPSTAAAATLLRRRRRLLRSRRCSSGTRRCRSWPSSSSAGGSNAWCWPCRGGR